MGKPKKTKTQTVKAAQVKKAGKGGGRIARILGKLVR